MDSLWLFVRSFEFYRRSVLSRDLIAGVTLAAIAVPEQMATARLGGFSPQIGFFAFLAGSLGFALFGNNRFLSCGADSTITPIFAGGLALAAASGLSNYPMLAAALALMVGFILVVSGLFRLGWIANLLSVPVTIGFLAGISAHIIVSQLPAVFGLPAADGPLLQRVATLVRHLNEANPFTLFIGFGVLVTIVAFERINARIPGGLVGLVLATVAVVLFGLESRGVAVLGVVSAALPAPAIPDISAARLVRLVPLSLLIAAVVMVQTAATTRSFPSDPNNPPNVDRDFVGVGIGNILSGLFGAFAVNSSPPRTAIVVATGGQSQVAGLVAAAAVLAVLVAGATLLSHVPHAALAGVLLFVALRIIRVRQIITIRRESLGEFFLVVATAVSIVALPIEQGVAIGIALSLLYGVWGTTRPRVIVYERVQGTSIWWPPSPNVKGEQEPNVVVVGFQAPLSFLNAYQFREGILNILKSSAPKPRLIVLEATGILDIDFTAAQILRDLVRECHRDGVAVAIARLESIRAQNAMTRFHIDDLLGPDHRFHSVEEAIHALRDSHRLRRAAADETNRA
jgi:MFS superfamily sulfate permease-like transporter